LVKICTADKLSLLRDVKEIVKKSKATFYDGYRHSPNKSEAQN